MNVSLIIVVRTIKYKSVYIHIMTILQVVVLKVCFVNFINVP